MRVFRSSILLVICALLIVGCKTTHRELNVKDPTGSRIEQCTDGSFSANCSTVIESQLPTGAVGGYGYGGYGGATIMSTPYPMVPYQVITPGMGAMMKYAGSSVAVTQPPSATSDAPATSSQRQQLQSLAAAVCVHSMEICNLKSDGTDCDSLCK